MNWGIQWLAQELKDGRRPPEAELRVGVEAELESPYDSSPRPRYDLCIVAAALMGDARLWRAVVAADYHRDDYFRYKQKFGGVSKSDLGPHSSMERSIVRLRGQLDRLLEDIPPPLAQEIDRKVRSFRFDTEIEAKAPVESVALPPDSDWLEVPNFLIQVSPVRVRMGPKLSARDLFEKFFRERVWEFPSSLSEERLREISPGSGLWFWADAGGEQQAVWARAVAGDYASLIGPQQRPTFPAPALPAFLWRIPLKCLMHHSGTFRPKTIVSGTSPWQLSKTQTQGLCGL